MERSAHENCAMTLSPSIIKNMKDKMSVNNNNNDEDLEEDGKQKTFIRALIDPKNNLDDREITDEINTLILAAQDTSAIASSASLLLLAMHKDKQDKVVEELRQVFGTSTENLYIDIEQINELRYLDMVINEAMRLVPVVPVVARTNEKEITLSEGYVIPAESNLIIPIFKIQRNKEYWGEDAPKFRPERFEKDDFAKVHPYAFIPFAKGPRGCVGWRYAMFLMKIQLANFLLRYELDTTLKLDELQFKFNITLTVIQGFMVSIKERRN
jgi:cytochrome P450